MDEYSQIIKEAKQLTEKGDVEGAIRLYNTAIEKHPARIAGYYELAMLCRSKGEIELAIDNFQKAAELNPLDTSIFNNLGVLYYLKGIQESAEMCFKRAIALDPYNVDAIYGLGKVLQRYASAGDDQKFARYLKELRNRITWLYERGKMEPAESLAERLVVLLPDSAESYNDYAVVLFLTGKIEPAYSAIKKAKELAPEDPDVQENYEIISREMQRSSQPTAQDHGHPHLQHQRKKLAFFCGPDDKFLRDIMEHFSSEYEIRRFQGRTVQEIYDLMKWSDISWFEWCDNLIVHAGRLPKVCKVICRLHSYEALTDIPQQVNWKIVDDLIFVAPHIKKIFMERFQELVKDVGIHVIHNGVDLKKFAFKERQKGFNIAYVGYINYKKNPSLLLQCIKWLIAIDNRYVLHIAGEHQDLRFKLYFEHMMKEMGLSKNVIFHGWIDDVSHWLEDKHFTLSTSVLESFCYGVAEAMACGLKPLIHNFVGAKELYPQKYLFNSVKEFGEMVLSPEYNPAEYRKYIEDNYSLERQFDLLGKLFRSVLEQ